MNDTGAQVIKRRRLREGPPRPLGASCMADDAEPIARLIEQNGRAVAVEVTCACGRKTYLELDYAPQAEPPAMAAPVGAE